MTRKGLVHPTPILRRAGETELHRKMGWGEEVMGEEQTRSRLEGKLQASMTILKCCSDNDTLSCPSVSSPGYQAGVDMEGREKRSSH